MARHLLAVRGEDLGPAGRPNSRTGRFRAKLFPFTGLRLGRLGRGNRPAGALPKKLWERSLTSTKRNDFWKQSEIGVGVPSHKPLFWPKPCFWPAPGRF